jgi:hypothetical protein
MILKALTIFHVALSLVGIGSGVVAIYDLLKAKTPGRWTQVFLATTAATSLTGFLFPFHVVTPAQALGVFSLIAVNREPCDLSVLSPGDLAPDLCNHRRDGVLFQRFCADRSAFPAGSGAKRHRPDPVRTTFPDSAARRATVVRGDRSSSRDRKAATGVGPVIDQCKGAYK